MNVRLRSCPKATTRELRTGRVMMHVPGRTPETVSITTEASTSTLSIERECAAVIVVFLFFFQCISLWCLSFLLHV